ncbi:MAG: FAD-dependent oxidoreductase [Polyangiaceae bacterium]
MRRIGIVGGGLAGLCVALWRSALGDRVVLFEAAPRLGGQIWTVLEHGSVIEHGAEGFVARSQALVELAQELGIAGALVDQLLGDSLRLEGGALIRLAPGEAARALGFQVDRAELGRGVRAFTLGMGQLTQTLAERVAERAEVRLGSAVRSVRILPQLALVHDYGEDAFDALVIATTAAQAAPVLGDSFGARALELARAQTSSSVTVSLDYPRSAVAHALDATGFVVTEPEANAGLRACTFVSSKLPARTESDRALLRCFFRPTPLELEQLDDGAGRQRGERALAPVLGISQPAEHAWVSRWPSALPIFDAAHVERVRALEAELGPRRIFLAGAAFHGSGIDAAVRSARAAATAIG